jgi:hypothetical protein
MKGGEISNHTVRWAASIWANRGNLFATTLGGSESKEDTAIPATHWNTSRIGERNFAQLLIPLTPKESDQTG